MDKLNTSNIPTVDRTLSHTFQTCLWVFLFLLAVRLVRAFIFKRDLTNDDCEVDRVAFALADHLGFANPFKIPTGPTSQYAPGYPLMLSWIYELFGKGSMAEAARQILSCIAVSLQFALLPALAAAAKVDARVGVLAALVGGLSPLRHWIETKATFETPYAALLLVIMSLLTLQVWKFDQPSVRQAWVYGAAWGLALLIAPQLLPILLSYLALGALRFYRGQFRSYLRFSLILLIAAGIVLAPWTIRNYRTFHQLMFVRRGFALMLNLSNNDSALPVVGQNIYTNGFQTYGPLYSLSAAQRVKEIGESAYYDQQLHMAYGWIGSHRRRFLRLTVDHIRYFWFPPLEPGLRGIISALFTWCVTLGGIASLLIMLERHRWPALAIGVIWLSYPLLYYLTAFDPRYRYPIEWTFLFAASYGLVTLIERVPLGILPEQVIWVPKLLAEHLPSSMKSSTRRS